MVAVRRSSRSVERPSSGLRQRVFVVGLGMVGIAFIEKMLSQDNDKRYKIITCGEEKHLAYNRVGLTEYFLHRSIENMYLNSPEWYTQQDKEAFEFHVGEQVTYIDVEKKVAHTNNGNQYEYDICVIATGSDAGMPPYCDTETGKRTKGVFVYRNIADLEKIITYAESPKINSATVVGGGLLGLEAAKAVYDLPTIPDVSIVNRSAYPLSRQLDKEAGEMVQRKIEAMGVKCVTSVNVSKMLVKQDEVDGADVFTGFEFDDGEVLEADMVVMAVGITPRDDLARVSGIATDKRGGIAVGDDLMTSAKDVYAMGECASWRGNTYGLIGPGVEMADILAFNLCQTATAIGSFAPRKMNAPDLSVKLKLMGVDVASFGDFFGDKTAGRQQKPLVDKVRNLGKPDHPNSQILEGSHVPGEPNAPQTDISPPVKEQIRRVKIYEPLQDEPIKCLTYKDPFTSTYKKYIFSGDGKHLIGGMMVGDVSDFVKMVSITKKKKPIGVSPSEFIVGAKKGEDDGADLDDDAVLCSCHNVSLGKVKQCVKDGAETIGDIKAKTKAITGCGGCAGLVTNVFNAEMKKCGKTVANNVCIHFDVSRMDLHHVIKVKKLRSFPEIMRECGKDKDSIGCETCRPIIANIILSIVGRAQHVQDPNLIGIAETNDRMMGNVQRDGTYSVIPKIAGGTIKPHEMEAIAEVARKYSAELKITGACRIGIYGIQKPDLPEVWAQLNAAGLESGHAYGKSLRSVKTCVGSRWCRYAVGDSSSLGIQLEERYKGVRSSHKLKFGISGCIRSCAESLDKDVGMVAVDGGWNIYVGGNGGITPRHGQLLIASAKPSQVIRVVDRYLMYYIETADKVQRTSTWLEKLEGGIEKLKKVILDDELGICKELEDSMDAVVGTYQDEWAQAVNDPTKQILFKQFVNTDERQRGIETIQERGATRPADWPAQMPAVKMTKEMIPVEETEWSWQRVCALADLTPTDQGSTSATVKLGDSQIAIFRMPDGKLYSSSNMCPHKRFFGLSQGITGQTADKQTYVSCPMHKRNFNLQTGACINDPDYSIITFEAKQEGDDILLRLPPGDALDTAIGTSKWMVRKATADLMGRGGATAVAVKNGKLQIVGPKEEVEAEAQAESAQNGGSACSDHKLDW